MSVVKTLGLIDYIIFGFILLASSVIGIYFGYKHRKKMTASEYLLANKSVSWFPIFVSLTVSFFSSVGVMGITANVYSTGVTFGLHLFAFIMPIALNAEVFAPIFRRLQLVSVNEYLELRFSKVVRFIGCLLFMLQYIVYLAIVLYAPGLALKTVANVPLLASIIATGVVCTFYTTLGGMRAVIWTDVFQASIMLIGLVGSAVLGILNIGSFDKIYQTNLDYKRLEIDLNPDPRGHHTIWGSLIGSPFAIMAVWTIGQPTVQRVVAARSLKDAKIALYCSFLGLFIIFALLILDAMVIFTTYFDCDLKTSGKIASNDQVLPYFIHDQFGHLPGVTGLFMACLFSFAISTLSSALNSLAAVFLEDIVKACNPTVTERWQTVISKITACACGVIVTGLAFAVPYIGNYIISLVIRVFGIVGGPYFGLFALGIFVHRSNTAGAIIGSMSGLGVGVALMVGQWYYPPAKNLPPISTVCNRTMLNETFIYPADPVYNNTIADVVSVSYMWFGLITVLVTVVVGILVSLCFGRCCDPAFLDKKLLYDYGGCCQCFRSCSCCKEKADYDCEVYDQELIRNGPYAGREESGGYKSSTT